MNTVTLGDDGIIYERYVGDQTKESIQPIVSEAAKLIKQLASEKKPILVYIDLSAVGRSDNNMRKYAVEVLQSTTFDRIALYSTDLAVKYVSNFIIIATGKSKKIRYFTNNAEALRWLKEI